jgi:hypothetical protein
MKKMNTFNDNKGEKAPDTRKRFSPSLTFVTPLALFYGSLFRSLLKPSKSKFPLFGRV